MPLSVELQPNPGKGLPAGMNTGNLLSEIATYIEGLFQTYRCPYLLYHNLDHTRQVVQHVEEIASQYKLDDRSFFIVLVAAWFHDTGQLVGDCEGHEEKSVQLMKGFLTGKNIDEKLMGDISHCIKVKVPCV